MANKFYLISGHTSTGNLKEIDRKALEDSLGMNVLVLNLASDDAQKLRERTYFFAEYFTDLGADNVQFIEPDSTQKNIWSRFENADLVYMPGGDTSTLLKHIKRKKLRPHLASLARVVAGNSAGAYALTPEYMKIGRGKPEVIPATGIVPFWVKCRYEKKFDEDLKKLSENRRIYALEDESALVFDKDDIEHPEIIGNIWVFNHGEKKDAE